MADTHGDFIKLSVDEEKVKVFWISTDENLIDIMTKPLAQNTYTYLKEKISNMKLNK